MTEFKLKVAGQVAQVRAMFETTPLYCKSYLTDEEPTIFVETTPADLEFEQRTALTEARMEGLKPRRFPDPYLERTAIQRKLAEALFARDILVFHGSAIALDGKGYLFTARSGTGKSTHTRLWRQQFPGAVMVNDDKPFLRVTPAGVEVCGSPWSGKHGLETNVTVPLAAICLLERGPENRIRRCDPRQLLPMLLQQSNRPLDRAMMPKYLDLVDALARHVPLWHLSCNMDPEAAVISHAAMSAE